MKLGTLVFLWLGLVLTGTGCRSYGPQFDARRQMPASDRADITAGRYSDSVRMDEGMFSSIRSTNQIRPEWLQRPTDFFTLGPGDTFEIEKLGENTSREVVLVGPDGKIYYSLLPGIFVWGLTLSEVKDLLEEELGKFLRVRPVLALTLKSVASKRVWILGQVGAPGVYSLATPLSILEAISAAGGIAQDSGSRTGLPDLQNSFLLRNGKTVKVDFYRLLSAGDMSQNIYLEPNDFLYLRSATVRNVYVMGAVAQPNLIPYREDLTLLSAIASAGGTAEYARVSHVAIVRGSIAYPKIAFLDFKAIMRGRLPDVKLEQGDVVYVPFVWYKKVAVLGESVLNSFVRAIAVNEGFNAVRSGGGRVQPSIPITREQ